MKEIVVEKLNNNEDTYIIGKIYVQEGTWVEADTKIAAIESSKTVEDLFASDKGYIHFLYSEGQEVKATEALAHLFSTKEEYEEREDKVKVEKPEEVPYHVTQKARAIVEEYGLTKEELLSLGIRLIKTKDLEQLLASRKNDTDREVDLSRNQLMVAETVATSHREIPQAFLVQKIDSTSCGEFIKEYAKRTGVMIGYGEILVDVLLKLAQVFPTFYAEYHGGKSVKISDVNAIGITFDGGNGLYIPVIRESEVATIDDIAEKMFSYKLKAMEGAFAREDLNGANISISINPGKNVLYVIPVIPPGQVAMISVTSPVEELAMDDDRIVKKEYLYVGLAYDHRVINGADAMDFMRGIADKMSEYKNEC